MNNNDCSIRAHWSALFRKVSAVIFLLGCIPAIAGAQSPVERRGWGYGFGAIGGTAGTGTVAAFHYGGGGERLIYRGVGIGAVFPRHSRSVSFLKFEHFRHSYRRVGARRMLVNDRQ